MNLRPVQNGEKRLLLDGAQFLFNEQEATAAVEIPPHLCTYPFVIVTHTTDRSSINSSLLHFLTAENAKRVGPWSGRKKGYMWKRVLEFATICNT
eukprot:7190060-Pyramimonas_sp.AAC.1